MSEHTRGRLFVGQAPRCYAENGGGEVLVATKADPKHRHMAMGNAHRAADCWNACEGMDDPAGEIARLRAERDEALDTLAKWYAPEDPAEGCDTVGAVMDARERFYADRDAQTAAILRKHGRLT